MLEIIAIAMSMSIIVTTLIRPVQTAVKLKRSYSYSLHYAASHSSTPPGQAVGYNRKRV